MRGTGEPWPHIFCLSHKLENGYIKQTIEEKRRREWVNISVENQHVGIPFPCQFLHCVGEEEKEKKILSYLPKAYNEKASD